MKFKLTHSLVAITMIASPLVFADTKIYAGADCDHHSGSTEYDRAGGGIRNKSASKVLVVMCPIIKDDPDKRIGGGSFHAVDQHVNQNVRCVVFSKHRSQTSNNTNKSVVLKTTGKAGYPQKVIIPPILDTGTEARHFMRCHIPPKGSNFSSVDSYQVVEAV